MDVGTMAVSPDGNLLAYTTDSTGFRQYTLHMRDLTTRRPPRHRPARRLAGLGRRLDHPLLLHRGRDHQAPGPLFRHTLGTTAAEDNLVFQEADDRFNLGVSRTRDGHYILIESGSHTTNEFRFLPADDPSADLRLIAPRVDEQEYYPDHRDGLFTIRSNDTGKNFRVVTAPVATPDRDHWPELIALDPDIPLEDFDLFQSFAVATRRKLGLPTLESSASPRTISSTPRSRSPSPNPPTRPRRTSTASSPPRSSATATSRSSRRPRSTSTTSPAPTPRFPS